MGDPLSTLASYVAPPVVKRLADGIAVESSAERFEAAVLFTDVAGFSALAEALVAEGGAAPERLSSILNQYFGRIIDIVTRHGGLVYDFAGDAVIAAFAVEDGDRRAAAHGATHCALELVETLHDMVVEEGHTLSLRTSVGLGSLWAVTVPDSTDRRYFIAAGSSFDEAVAAQDHGGRGEAVASPTVWATVAPFARGEELADGYVRLRAVEPWAVSEPQTVTVPEAMEAELRRYVPAAVLAAAASGSSEWRAELRKVVVLFLRLEGLRYDADDALSRAVTALAAVDVILRRYGGAIHQFVVDDKGTIVLAAWGLPGTTHESNASRALSAASRLPEELARVGEECSVGVAAGRVFCGDRGSEVRREYAMIGTAVNRAARLMAAAGGRVLCDGSALAALESERSGADVRLEPVAPIRIKGAEEPVQVFRPVRTQSTRRRSTASGRLVGRHAERRLLEEALSSFAIDPTERRDVVIIEGEAGIGKSRLMSIVRRDARDKGLRVLTGTASAIENTAAYHAWRPVFEAVFDPGGGGIDSDRARATLAALLPGDEELLPLLNPVLGLDVPDSELTRQMQGEARANVTTRLLTRLLGATAGGRGTLIEIEDAHWLDSASWALLANVRREVGGVLLALSTRPLPDPKPRGYDHVADAATWVRPGALTRADLSELVPMRLGVTEVDGRILDFIFERGAGNPFFTEEIAYALRDGEHLAVRDGRCSLKAPAAPLNELVPATIEGTVATRIDRLASFDQLALKVASVIERDFSLSALEACFPLEGTRREDLLRALRGLTRVDLTIQSGEGDDPSFTFKHAITQRVAYDMLPFAQRKGLHLSLATWLEETHADNLAPAYPMLAHHYAESETTAKAIEYLDLAGHQALRSDANHEALSFLERARTLVAAREAGEGEEGLETARRVQGVAEAYRRLGKIPEAEEHLREALERLKRRVPGGRAGVLTRVVGLTAHQLRSRLREGSTLRKNATIEERDALRLAYLSYDQFARIAFLNMSTDLTVYGTLGSLSEAERLGPSPELARAYALMCGAAGLIPMERLARMYERKALETVELIGEEESLAAAFVLQAIAVFTSGVGDWARTERYLRTAIRLFERYGDWSEMAVTQQMLSRWAAARGRFEEVGEIGRRMMEFSRSRDALVEQTWSVNNEVECLLFTSNAAEQAVGLCRQALGLLSESGEASARALTNGLLATAHVRMGAWEEAAEAADRATTILSGMQPTSYGMLVAYATAAWSWLDCLEAAVEKGDDTLRDRSAARGAVANDQLRAFAKVFPIGRPRALLAKARAESLRGRTARALKAATSSLAAAVERDMPYERLLAHFELGRMNVPMAREARMYHLQSAQQLASHLGVEFDKRRASDALKEFR